MTGTTGTERTTARLLAVVLLAVTGCGVEAATPPASTGSTLISATAIAGGRGHTCAVLTGGTVVCWGGNNHGQLGDGTSTRRLTPVPVTGLSGATTIRVGGDHSCAIVADGAVRCWGANASGQLGDGGAADHPTPVTVPGLSGVTALAAGRDHTCAVTGGRVYCWGGNARGQLGDGTTHDRALPTPVPGLSGVTAIGAADAFHTCALSFSGTVSCWGWDHRGQLGGGVPNEPYDPNRARPTPALVAGIDGVVAITVAGAADTCALRAGGDVWCWGWNAFGQLGVGGEPSGDIFDTAHSATPVRVTGLTGVTALSQGSGTGQMCAIDERDTLNCWGHNGLGQLGDGGNEHRSTPVAVPGLDGLDGVGVVAGGADHTCAIAAHGAVTCWGFNNEGQLGDGTTTNRPVPTHVRLADAERGIVPVPVHGLSGVSAVAAGGDHTCAVVDHGAVRCWGDGRRGQLGTGATTDSGWPVTVPELSEVTAISTGGDHTCAIAAGMLRCWGWNGFGQLGDGTFTDRPTPVTVPLAHVTAVAAGRQHTCAVAEARVWCWGHNFVGGPLGVPSGSSGGAIAHAKPIMVQNLDEVSAVTVRGGHTCAWLHRSGAWCWGWGIEGQLGTGQPAAGPNPVGVLGLTGLTALSAGSDHTCALTTDTHVWCWGRNPFGQLGDGSTTDRAAPVPVPLTDSVAITAGADHSCALSTAGTVRCWGDNTHGQLGDPTLVAHPRPVTVHGLPTAVAVTAGLGHTCALTVHSTVLCWGHDDRHQLGDERPQPTR